MARTRPFPAAATSVRKLVKDPKTQVNDLARAVEEDVGISTDLLRLANAPTSGLRYRCTSVRQAISLLGMRRVVTVVDAAAAIAVMERGKKKLPGLAAHAIAVAGVMRMLAPIAALSPDEAFTAGLLHDGGVLLLSQSGDQFYEALIEDLGESREPRVEDEVELVGFDHAAVGGAVLRVWNLPEDLARMVEIHHDWQAALEAEVPVQMLVAVLRAAEAIVAWAPVLTTPTHDDLEPLFIEPAFEHLGITRAELMNMWDGLKKATTRAHNMSDEAAAPEKAKDRDAAESPSRAVYVAAPSRTAVAAPASSNAGVIAGIVAAVAALAGAAYYFL